MTTALAVTSKDMNATNALSVLTLGPDYREKMNPLDLMIMEEGEDDTEAFDFRPTRVKVAGGGGRSFQQGDGSMIPAPQTGVIILAVKTRGYWSEKEGNKIPLCSSVGNVFGTINENYTEDDLKGAATARVPHPLMLDLSAGGYLRPSYSCAGCPMDEFGSAHQGGESGAKACKEKVLLFILLDGWFQPVVLAVPTMSIAPWNVYCSSLKASTRKPYYAVKTKIDIESKKSAKNQPYGLMQFSVGSAIDNVDTMRAVLALQGEARKFLHANAIEIVAEGSDSPFAGGRVVDEDGVIIDQ